MPIPTRRQLPVESWNKTTPAQADRLPSNSTNELLYSSARQVTAVQARGPSGLTGTVTIFVRNGTDTSAPIVWELIAGANELRDAEFVTPIDCPNGVFIERDGDASVTVHSQEGGE